VSSGDKNFCFSNENPLFQRIIVLKKIDISDSKCSRVVYEYLVNGFIRYRGRDDFKIEVLILIYQR